MCSGGGGREGRGGSYESWRVVVGEAYRRELRRFDNGREVWGVNNGKVTPPAVNYNLVFQLTNPIIIRHMNNCVAKSAESLTIPLKILGGGAVCAR